MVIVLACHLGHLHTRKVLLLENDIKTSENKTPLMQILSLVNPKYAVLKEF
jgi:hypothetical protein